MKSKKFVKINKIVEKRHQRDFFNCLNVMFTKNILFPYTYPKLRTQNLTRKYILSCATSSINKLC